MATDRQAARRGAMALRGLLVAAAVTAWLVPGWDLLLRTSQAALALAGLAAGLLVHRIPARRRPHLLWRIELALTSLFLGNFVGHAFGLYGGFGWFDLGLHAAGGFLAGLAGWWLAQATELFWDEGRARPFRAFWVAWSFALVFGALFEVAEFATDAVLGTGTQEGPAEPAIVDTMLDIIAETGTGLLAGLVAAAEAARRERRPRRQTNDIFM